MSLSPDPIDPSVTDPSKRIAPVLDDGSDIVRPAAHAGWSWASAGFLTLLAFPLIFFPRILSLVFGSLLAETGDPEAHEKPGADVLRTLNILERSLAGLAGMSCLALAAILIIQTGALPLTSSLTASREVAASAVAAPFRGPTIWCTVFFFAALAWTSYGLGLLSIAVPAGVLGASGMWVLLFAHEGRVNRVSAKASSFPFKNVPAQKKKEQKKAQ
ncbi:hypothetical protein JCM10213_007331 [Rhodosporidiobolus nylandii]